MAYYENKMSQMTLKKYILLSKNSEDRIESGVAPIET